MTRAAAPVLAACATLVLAVPAPAVPARPERAADAAPARVVWRDVQRAAAPDSASRAAFWRERDASAPGGAAVAHVRGALAWAAGDTAGADTCWARASAVSGPWQWDALAHRAQLLARSRGPAAADSLLEHVPLIEAAESERGAWLALRAALRAAAGDAPGAATFARQVLSAYPAVSPAAARSLALLDSLAASRGDSLDVETLRAAAEVDVFRGARSAAIARLRRARARVDAAHRGAVSLRLAQVLREGRYALAAAAEAETAARHLDPGPRRDTARLERARGLRDAWRTDSAFTAYALVGRTAADGATRETAWWELGREAEDRGRYRDALGAFARVAQGGGRRAEAARVRAGLAYVALGAPDSARSWLRAAHGEDARFWLGVTLRARERAAGDSLLAALAALPGYGFYRAAARETLGVRGWPEGAVVAAADTAALAIAPDVAVCMAGGRDDDAALLLSRWLGHDTRVEPAYERGDAAAALAAASLAFTLGRVPLATRLAERAFGAAAGDSAGWAIVPWAYPPAFAREVAAAETLGVERALLWALVRQESRFEPRARSKSDALGLAQMKLGTAADMARRLREPAPEEATLFEPGPALRWGAAYLAGLMRRFGGDVPVALTAYNAGASTIRPDWRALVERGGDALFAEYASNADSQDYVKRVLGFRTAYRELRPAPEGAR